MVDPTHAAGLAFERYVIGLFGKDFTILNWIQDGSERARSEIDFMPDLLIRHNPTGDVFAVECKFRSSRFEGSISWAKEYQIGKYDRYRNATGNQVFIVIGLKGEPEAPGYMYCIPLWQARGNILDTLGLKRYRRDPRRKFVWDKKAGGLI